MNDKAIYVKNGIYRFGTNVEEKTTINANGAAIPGIGLFEGLWPIPNGASINAYVVMDEKNKKNVLIDLICEWDGQRIEIEDEFRKGSFSIEDIDYIILNHMEPDHSGWLPFVFKKNPKIKIITNRRSIDLVQNFFHIGMNPKFSEHVFIEIKDGDMIDLKDGSVIPVGKNPNKDHGRLLTFIFIPNVHWPETMVTYDTQEKVLFPCDAFGSYGRIVQGGFFADQLPAICKKCQSDQGKSHHFSLEEFTRNPECVNCYKREALRYYANIVASFSGPVIQAITKVAKILDLETEVLEGKRPHFGSLEVIAPSHGLIWRNNDKGYGNPIEIINYFLEMAKRTKGPGREKICVVWGSMYGNTQRILPHILRGIESESVEYEVFHLPYDNIGFSMASAFESQGLVLGMPTYEYAMYPPMAHFLDILKRKHIKGKDTLRFGSFGWSGGAQKELMNLTTEQKKNLSTGEIEIIQNFNFIESLEWKGSATEEVEKIAFARGAELAKIVKESIKKSQS